LLPSTVSIDVASVVVPVAIVVVETTAAVCAA
jgi:hypothetical protein